MTRQKGTADLKDAIRSTVNGGIPPNGDATGGLYAAAAEAIRSGDDAAAIAAIRDLDEARPRDLLIAFRMAIQAEAEAARAVAAGEGQAARAVTLEHAAALLKRTPAENAEKAIELAREVEFLEREQRDAVARDNAAMNAAVVVAALHDSMPRLFGLPATGPQGNPDNITVEMDSYLKAVGIRELECRDGWLFSKLIAPPPGPRRRLRARG